PSSRALPAAIARAWSAARTKETQAAQGITSCAAASWVGDSSASPTAYANSTCSRRALDARARVLKCSSDNRVQHFRCRNLVLRDRHQVFREHGDVCQLADRERSLDLFVEPGVRRVDRVGAERFHPAHALVL